MSLDTLLRPDPGAHADTPEARVNILQKTYRKLKLEEFHFLNFHFISPFHCNILSSDLRSSRPRRQKVLHSSEERMLVVVLISIIVLFVVCTTPAAVLSVLYTVKKDQVNALIG